MILGWNNHVAFGAQYHCFDANQITLCGKWQMPIAQQPQTFTPDADAPNDRDTCKTCLRIRAASTTTTTETETPR